MASVFVKLQSERLAALPHAEMIVAELSWDETETLANVQGCPNETANLMTLHLRLAIHCRQFPETGGFHISTCSNAKQMQ